MDEELMNNTEVVAYGTQTKRNFVGIRAGSVHVSVPATPKKGRPLQLFFVRNSLKEAEDVQRTKAGLSNDLCKSVKENFDSNLALAEALGVAPSAVAMALHQRGFTRDQILCVLLLLTKTPNWKEANRWLMKFGEPSLCLSEGEGTRNCLIGMALEDAAKKRIGAADYLGLLQIALREMNLPLTVGKKHTLPPTPRLRAEERELIETWKAFAEAQEQPCALDFRLQLLDAYCEKHYILKESGREGPDRAAAYERIVAWMGEANAKRNMREDMKGLLPNPPSKSALMKYFQKASFRYGTRADLVWVFSALGVSLEEMNRVLREANHAILYPSSVLSSERLLIKLFYLEVEK